MQVEADGGEAETITLVAEPLPGQEPDRPYLIVFKSSPAKGIHVPTSDAVSADGVASELERELRDSREQLQSLHEEHETALEELRSSNEELHSVKRPSDPGGGRAAEILPHRARRDAQLERDRPATRPSTEVHRQQVSYPPHGQPLCRHPASPSIAMAALEPGHC